MCQGPEMKAPIEPSMKPGSSAPWARSVGEIFSVKNEA